MSKIKDTLTAVNNNIKEYFKNMDIEKSNRLAKIISFFVGLIFNIFGVIAVAIWKYLFCNDERKSKYCIRLSIFGVIVKFIILVKMVQFAFYPFVSSPFYFFHSDKQHNNIQKYKFIDDDFDNFDEIFENNIRSFNKMRKDFYRNFNENFDREFAKINNDIKEIKENMEKQIEKQSKLDNNKDSDTKVIKENKNGVNITKSFREKDGYREEVILKEFPNGYEKTITKNYNNFKKNDKSKDNQIKFNKKQKNHKNGKKNNNRK